MKGKVFLVGAGPGDKGLLTLKGAELLSSADVIVCDRLVSEEVFRMIPKEKPVIDVGKNAGDHAVPQKEINDILLQEALAGRQVVRLKGGDPFLFGRGGEELESLVKNDIPFEVVPGVTSSVAAPAYGGIPVTHRDFCSSLHIVTGHRREGAHIDIDYEALTRTDGTIVLMMSISNSSEIARGFMDAGMDGDMPCAVVENGTLPEQRSFYGTLKNLEGMIRENHVSSPAVIIIGRVCSMRETFNWYDRLPLKGKRILVTQPVKKMSRMAEALGKQGAQVRLYPCVDTRPIRPISPPYEKYDVLVFTSSEGVDSFCSWILEKGKDMRTLGKTKIAVIGSATGRALSKYGLVPDFVPEIFSGERLAVEMTDKGFVDEHSKVLLLRTDAGSEEIIDVLKNRNIDFIDYPVYETFNVKDAPVDMRDYHMTVFTSRSGVQGFVKNMARRPVKGTMALCIGAGTEKAARKAGFKTLVSAEATIESMVEKAIEYFERNE